MVQTSPQNGSEVPRASLPVSGSPAPASPEALRGSEAASTQSSVLSPQSSVLSPQSSTLSQRDRDLLSALSNPSTDADSVLSTLPPDEVGPWLERPEIQSAIAAAFELREIRLRFKLNAATDRALDRMTAVFDANKDLNDATQRTETRRAASAIFRVARAFQPVSSRVTDRAANLCAARLHPAHQDAASSPLTQDSGQRTQDPRDPSIAQRLKDLRANITAANAVLRAPHSTTRPLGHSTTPAAEKPPLDTTTPQASIAAVLNAFKQLPTDGPRAAYDLVQRALADPVNENPVFKERFLTYLAASPALTARHRPFTLDPLQTNGAVATQRVTYTLEDGTKTAAIFRAARRDPKAWESFPTPSWPLDCIYPADTS